MSKRRQNPMEQGGKRVAPVDAAGPVVVAVADSARARLFEAPAPAAPLREVEDLQNAQARLHEGDLVADRAGRMKNRPFQAAHSAFGGDTARRHRAEDFAAIACSSIGRILRRSGARRLYLVADPEFLGLLRQRMEPSLRHRVAGEVVKSLAGEPAERIRAVLPRRL